MRGRAAQPVAPKCTQKSAVPGAQAEKTAAQLQDEAQIWGEGDYNRVVLLIFFYLDLDVPKVIG